MGEQAEQGEQKSQMPKNAQQEGFEVLGWSDEKTILAHWVGCFPDAYGGECG